MTGTDGAQLQGLVDEQTVYAALDAIDQVLERALVARTESRRHRELVQLRGVLLTFAISGGDLEGALRHLIGVLRFPILDR
jgi:hypothetical protein